MSDTAAVVVSYFPNKEILINLINSLLIQVDFLILIDNGGFDVNLDFGKKFKYIKFEKNLGLGHALNVGFEEAVKLRVKYVATFDQDSDPPSNLIKKLKQIHIFLEKDGVRCAAVGPTFFDRREHKKVNFNFYMEKNGGITSVSSNDSISDYIETDLLITSGMLIRIDVWLNSIRYNPELFVDFTDIDWCFRARQKNYKIFGSFAVEMGHALSDAPPVRIFGVNFFKYSPLRRYYFFRNTINFCKEDFVSLAWKNRLIAGLFLRFFINLIIDTEKIQSLKMMTKGIKHGLSGRLGQFNK